MHPDRISAAASDEGLVDVRLSRRMSFLLRHSPSSANLTLDEAGWVRVDALADGLSRPGAPITTAQIEAVVAACPKQRFALSPDRLRTRANQGHSVPVDLQLAPQEPPPVLFHGTPVSALADILSEGLTPRQRHHVHLSANPDTATAVGARRGTPVVLRVDAAGLAATGALFFRTENDVWLTAHVPAGFLRVPDLDH